MMPVEPPSPAPARASGRLIGTLALAVLTITGGTYAWLGNPRAWHETPSAAASAPFGPATDAAHAEAQIAAMVQRLKDRLAQKPDDAEGWTMLGRSHLVLNQPAEAVAAFRKRSTLKPGDADALTDLADAVAFAAGRRFDGEPEQLINQALKLDPRNPKALELSGTMAFDRAQYPQAVAAWQAAVAVLDPQNPSVANLQAGIAEAQRRSGTNPADTPAATAGARISGRVVLANALKAQVKPDDTVLIFARLVDGPRMPVAVLKRKASELPLDFQLDESTAMNPQLRLSPSMQVVVGVRVSRSGQAMPQAGDLQGFSEPVPVGTAGLRIEIKQRVE